MEQNKALEHINTFLSEIDFFEDKLSIRELSYSVPGNLVLVAGDKVLAYYADMIPSLSHITTRLLQLVSDSETNKTLDIFSRLVHK